MAQRSRSWRRRVVVGLAAAALGPVMAVAALGAVAAAVAVVLATPSSSGSANGPGFVLSLGTSATTTTPLPPTRMLDLYRAASTTCPGLPWTVLAAIGTVESDNDTSTLPGVHAGANAAGAEGPMQFEPATFAAYDRPVPPGGAVPPSPYDPVDAVYAAARLLCADGGRNGADLPAAVFAYNHSEPYVSEVFTLAAQFQRLAG